MARSNEFASYLADVQKQTMASVKAMQDLALRGFELASGSTTKAPSPTSVIEAGFALAGQTLAYQKAWALTFAGAAEKTPA